MNFFRSDKQYMKPQPSSEPFRDRFALSLPILCGRKGQGNIHFAAGFIYREMKKNISQARMKFNRLNVGSGDHIQLPALASLLRSNEIPGAVVHKRQALPFDPSFDYSLNKYAGHIAWFSVREKYAKPSETTATNGLNNFSKKASSE